MLDKAEYSAFESTLNSSIVSYRIVCASESNRWRRRRGLVPGHSPALRLTLSVSFQINSDLGGPVRPCPVQNLEGKYHHKKSWSVERGGQAQGPPLNTPLGVDESSTSLHWLGLRRRVVTCVRWQVILCDPIWQATPRSSEMDFH